MKIICVSCPEGAPEIEEGVNGELYAQHMAKFHGGGQLSSIQAQRNVPKPHLPPGIKPGDLPQVAPTAQPTPEFLQTVAEIEAVSQLKPQANVQPPFSAPPLRSPVAEKKLKPIELTYKYIGNDSEGHEIATLEVDVNWKHFVIAFCSICNKQIQSREVAILKGEKLNIPVKAEPVIDKTGITAIRKAGENNETQSSKTSKKRKSKTRYVKDESKAVLKESDDDARTSVVSETTVSNKV